MKLNLTNEKMLIGMVHLEPLPGTPLFEGDLNKVYARAVQDALALKQGGIAALMIENAGDIPFPKHLDSVQTACLAAITFAIKRETGLLVGIDAAFCDYLAALSSAKAATADFVRLAVFVDNVATASGVIEACAQQALRYRKQIEASEIAILADIHVKYSHTLIPEISLLESAKNAQASLADGIIVTGAYSGNETPIDLVKKVKSVVSIPVFVGSGVDEHNVREQLAIADGAIVGTSLKTARDGRQMIDPAKVQQLTSRLKGA